MFDQHPDKTFHRAERCPVDHHRAVRPVVGTDVIEIETFRQVVVQLHRAQLPFTSDAVADHEIGLGPVKGRLAGTLLVVQPRLLQHVPQASLGQVPVLLAAHVLVTAGFTQRELDAIVVESDRGEHELDQLERLAEFLLDLVRRAELVRVVLGQAPDAQHSVEFTGLLVTVHGAELGQPHRQFTVAARLGLVDLHVVRAVHRLQQESFLSPLPVTQERHPLVPGPVGRVARRVAPQHGRGGTQRLLVRLAQRPLLEPPDPTIDQLAGVVSEQWCELRIAVIGKVTAGLVQLDTADVGRVDRVVATGQQLGLNEILEPTPHPGALGHPQAQSLADLRGDREQPVLLAQYTVITSTRLLDPFEICRLLLLAEPGSAVETLKTTAVAGVALPV